MNIHKHIYVYIVLHLGLAYEREYIFLQVCPILLNNSPNHTYFTTNVIFFFLELYKIPLCLCTTLSSSFTC